MKIIRHGAGADHGTFAIDLDDLRVTWNPDGQHVLLKAKSVSDFNTYARHNYEIAVSLEELGRMLVAVGGSLSTDT